MVLRMEDMLGLLCGKFKGQGELIKMTEDFRSLGE